MNGFVELVAASNFSFLHGASHPAEMVGEAIALGLKGLGIADRNTVAGVVRAWVTIRDIPARAKAAFMDEKEKRGEPLVLSPAEEQACKVDLRVVSGARLVFADGTPDIVVYPATRHGWGRLTRLLTVGNLRAVKGDCILHFEDLLAYLDDLLLIVMTESTARTQESHRAPVDYALQDEGQAASQDAPPRLSLVPPPTPRGLEAVLARLASVAPGRVWLGAALHRRGSDGRRLARLRRLAAGAGVPLLATNDALYAEAERRPLHDVLTCIREGTTIADAGRRLEANGERHLKNGDAMARLFRTCPEAVRETTRFLARIDFDLKDLEYEYPHEPVPEGWEPQDWLEHLVIMAARERYGDQLPEKVEALLADEFAVIRKQEYAYYFLTVHDLVRFARAQQPPILCQGRGSAANSIVCFLLGVTSVDPEEHDLLFSRFVSADRDEPPDIDVDFEHERREEIIQYIYRRYGRHRAGIAATVIHYRARSAVREVAKVLGLTEDISTRLAGLVWGSHADAMDAHRMAEAGFDPANPEMERLRFILRPLLTAQFPRHLSQHVGGFVLTQNRLDETVPIHHAGMEGRSFIEWDKDDIDALNLMKVDVLALGMLTCIRKAFELMRTHGLGDQTLEVDIRSDDPAVYDMLGRGDSIGVFQVESRAQINMLPRLKPRDLYDLTIQVAIVRPGPIEGDMVHPYLRRRCDAEPWGFPEPAPPHDPKELHKLLGKTFGVPLFQEQAMKLAIVAAGFTPNQANQLRKAMATFRNAGTIHNFEKLMVDGMVARGYEPDFARRCFKQIEGFGSYGFPESHALSFARLVYVSAWIKCHHPAVFACALLNAQPMGFYAPAQIVRDASQHQVEVCPVDVHASLWDNTLERGRNDRLALRLGLRQVEGFREGWADGIAQARRAGRFPDMEALARRAHLPSAALRLLADADALKSLGLERRNALWEVRRMPEAELPLFASAKARELGMEDDMALPDMSDDEHVALDYQTTRLSLKGHPMAFLRPAFRSDGVLSCEQTSEARDGAQVRTAGLVLVRQRPGKGNAIFVTLEDETGITNVLIWARLFETLRRAVMSARLMQVSGKVQRSREGVVHLMAEHVEDRTALLDSHFSDGGDAGAVQRPTHPRDVRILPKSRDFH
ncbi:error-prone DNA polymerase 1 [Azorhizobium oxalatiphilum]|uniref:Error-prone DNA polymerase n=1 Tax=Azorhizobium oxalatiphilum TaxID=980631 RepID=A0A917FKS5_9HYPH|nr:error-prone DNA polymerase [Azorhizobium oxalatiphilum]GGF88528.1 error-prone DNA polymerase 1 [Azorhizobium oxalatiphilum]